MLSPRLLLPLLGLLATTPAFAEITLTFGGDMNFNSSRVNPRPDGALKGGRLWPYSTLLAGIAPHIDGDLNFANVETVVSERALPDTHGTFVFNTHPNALRAAIKAGFNLFNLSNNHMGDHGTVGMNETLRNMEALAKESGVHFSGLGGDRDEALAPAVFTVRANDGRSYRIAMLSMTGVANQPCQADAGRPGTLYLRDPQDFADAMRAMRRVRADYKILSLHWGTEGQVTLNAGQRALYERALKEGDIDLILGHHPHRVRPVERFGHKVIFYSLGNYLMLGAANINGQNPAKDYGLLGKLHLSWDAQRQRLVAQAAEAIPLYDMQLQPKAYSDAEAATRIKGLNALGRSQLGENAVEFKIGRRGFGRACLGPASGPKAAAICRDLSAPAYSEDGTVMDARGLERR